MSNSRGKSTRARGYGARHQQLRRSWARRVVAGGVDCARCGGPIVEGMEWHLDHTPDRTGYLGPSHADCNLRNGRAQTERRNGNGRSFAEMTPEERFARGLCSRVW